MISIENVEVWGWEHAIRGMRNPMNSWDRSDSEWREGNMCDSWYAVGDDDLRLMTKLTKAGQPHRKFLRQIMVSMDITTNATVWQEFDTYKVGVTRNSCSKMHKIHVKEFERDDFSHEGISEVGGHTEFVFDMVIKELEHLRKLFNETHEKKYWRAIIDLLPMGYNMKATITLNYEVLLNMWTYRRGHKMFEWVLFCEWVETLPHFREIAGVDDNGYTEDL